MRSKSKTFFFFFLAFLIILCCNYSSISYSINPLINYIQDKQILSIGENYGGFINIDGEQNVTVETTAKGIIILRELESSSSQINEGVISYCTSCEQLNGGFAASHEQINPELKATFWAISAFNSINSLDWISNSTIYWIKNRQMLNVSENWNYGGFELKENSSLSTVESTYYAIQSLYYLSKLNLINVSATIEWLKNRQLDNGGFENFDGLDHSDLASTYFATSSLLLLNKINMINKTSLLSFIIEKQNLNKTDLNNYGGFGNIPIVVCSGLETYYSIGVLSNLNTFNSIKLVETTLFLERLQNLDGGFALSYLSYNSSLISSYYAYITLKFLSSLNQNNPNSNYYIYLISTIFIIITLGSITIAYIIKKKVINNKWNGKNEN